MVLLHGHRAAPVAAEPDARGRRKSEADGDRHDCNPKPGQCLRHEALLQMHTENARPTKQDAAKDKRYVMTEPRCGTFVALRFLHAQRGRDPEDKPDQPQSRDERMIKSSHGMTASVPLPKFASLCGTAFANFGIEGH